MSKLVGLTSCVSCIFASCLRCCFWHDLAELQVLTNSRKFCDFV